MRSTTADSDSSASMEFLADPDLASTLSSADALVTAGMQGIQFVYQARLSQAKRTAAGLSVQYGASDARVVAANSTVTGIELTAARVSMFGRQLTAPTVEVAKAGWALQGLVHDAQLNPAAKFTVFMVDEEKAFLRAYGFAYTDATGYFLINYAGPAGAADKAAAAAPALFIEVADTKGNPVYLSPTAFQPQLGVASYQTIVLPAGAQPIGDPPAEIRAVALPAKARGGAKGKGAKGKGK